MKLLQKSLLVSAFIAASVLAKASVTFGSSAFSGVSLVKVGDVGVLIIDNNNSGFGSVELIAGMSITANATYGDFTVALNTSKTAIANGLMSGAFAGVDITGAAGQGDKFAFVTFENSTTTILEGDTYRIWTDLTWVIPPDGNYNFQASPTGLNFKQMGASSVPAFTKVVSAIPEPSSFAALAGLGILGAVVTRRRRSA